MISEALLDTLTKHGWELTIRPACFRDPTQPEKVFYLARIGTARGSFEAIGSVVSAIEDAMAKAKGGGKGWVPIVVQS